MNNDFVENGYLLRSLPSVNEVKPCFDTLVVDPYYGKYRYKAISRFNFIDNKAILLPHYDFFQSKEYNPVAGDVVRNYPPIDERIAKSNYFFDLFKDISKCIDLSPITCFTIHQIRVISSLNKVGLAAAEGIHQDGYDYIALNCISKKNIVGGVTSLYSKEKQKVFEKELASGDILYINDRQLFHYTTPIKSVTSREGHRDMLIVTLSLSGICDAFK